MIRAHASVLHPMQHHDQYEICRNGISTEDPSEVAAVNRLLDEKTRGPVSAYSASSPRSPVRMRIESSKSVTKILPSPICPVWAVCKTVSMTV